MREDVATFRIAWIVETFARLIFHFLHPFTHRLLFLLSNFCFVNLWICSYESLAFDMELCSRCHNKQINASYSSMKRALEMIVFWHPTKQRPMKCIVCHEHVNIFRTLLIIIIIYSTLEGFTITTCQMLTAPFFLVSSFLCLHSHDKLLRVR